MDAIDPTSSIIHFGWFTTLVIDGFVLSLLLWLIALQTMRQRRTRRRASVVEVWQPILLNSLTEIPDALPPLAERDHVSFLFLWNYLQQSIKGESAQQLNVVARRVGGVEAARTLLRKRNLRHKLLAVTTLGHLREPSAWDDLRQLAGTSNSVLSIEAVRAMVRIDAAAAIPHVAPLIGTRQDWSPLTLMTILNEAGPALVAETMAQVTVAADPHIAARLVRYLAATRCVQALPAVRTLLERQGSIDDVTATCLSFFGECSDPHDLEIVRSHLGHPTWYVRLQAAAALGKMGVEEDEQRLIALLDDSHWWVRYRAAEALAALPSMTEEKLAELQTTMPTMEAQEIVIPFIASLRARGMATTP